EWSYVDTFGDGGQRGQRRPDLPRPPGDAARQVVEQVVAQPDRVEADRLGGAGHREQLGPLDPALDLGQLDTDETPTRHPRTLLDAGSSAAIKGECALVDH